MSAKEIETEGFTAEDIEAGFRIAKAMVEVRILINEIETNGDAEIEEVKAQAGALYDETIEAMGRGDTEAVKKLMAECEALLMRFNN